MNKEKKNGGGLSTLPQDENHLLSEAKATQNWAKK